MKLTATTLSHADQVIRDCYADLNNKGPVTAFIESGNHTADFELPEYLTMRVKQEKNSIFYCVFRAK